MNSSENTTLHNMKKLSGGDIVQVYDCDGVIWDRVLWAVDGNIAYLSSQECYQRMLNGDSNARPVGFLISDLVQIND